MGRYRPKIRSVGSQGSGIPLINAAERHWIFSEPRHRWSIYFGDKRRRVRVQKLFDPRYRGDKALGKFRERRLANDNKQHDVVTYHSSKLIRFVPNAAVVSDRHPFSLPHVLQPDLIRTRRRKKIDVPSHVQSPGAENFRKALAQVSVGEIDPTQAARS